MKPKILNFLVAAVILASCSTKTANISTPVFLTFKTQKLKFSDMAFIINNNGKISIDGYYAGKHVLNISFGAMVCIENGCMTKDEFNARFLSYNYYDNLFLDILRKRPLAIDAKVEKSQSGFSQSSQNIFYSVTKDETHFKDTKNKILIKIKELQ